MLLRLLNQNEKEVLRYFEGCSRESLSGNVVRVKCVRNRTGHERKLISLKL